MKKCLVILFLTAFFSAAAFAAGPREYQVTGPVLEIKDDVVIVQKGKEKWEIALDKVTKIEGGELKVGSKVTVYYFMKASKIEVQGQKEKQAPKAGAAKKP
ncbi:hypothetical protein [Syntrophobacter fumaroxidans]|uniref:DUF5666 domain-containing protein n=1 Tax=Syntrophobacter fumaroxidans (strain DSM 10017 / MPOB) TaxID=335543 RepID=A0LJX0_SYNFM|nr:hypothetical protein [Syntrophobacter fumaroxidans]ABK17722.1 conserved hypothetical protein [Syntrophobacter fumaroxidans MPOB]